jgi:hypothetical protein
MPSRLSQMEDSRGRAVERLHGARDRRIQCSREYESARGSSRERAALAALEAADEQFAAREACLKWIDRDY